VKRRATEGDREAQWSMGYLLLSQAGEGAGDPLGASGSSPQADVGLEFSADKFPVVHMSETRGCGHLMTTCFICGP